MLQLCSELKAHRTVQICQHQRINLAIIILALHGEESLVLGRVINPIVKVFLVLLRILELMINATSDVVDAKYAPLVYFRVRRIIELGQDKALPTLNV